MQTIRNYLSLIKFSHTIFALPFAVVGYILAVIDSGIFSWRTFSLVLLCMVFARTAAMAFNRYLDRDIDRRNERTASREIPAGVISPVSALLFIGLNALLFVATTYFINLLCFYLSPVALLVILGYSYTKRFTFLCHFVLGLGLALAPIGAYLAGAAAFAFLPILFGIIVLTWVSGFDIIYALQDEQFDRSLHLQSVPVRLGRGGALRFSVVLHLVCAACLLLAAYLMLAYYAQFGWLLGVATLLFLGLLFYQHTLVSEHDLSRINLAFFTTNGIASLVFGIFVVVDVYF